MIGRYYARYNQLDSYLEGHGQDLVNSIPKEKYTGEIQLKASSGETLDRLDQNG